MKWTLYADQIGDLDAIPSKYRGDLLYSLTPFSRIAKDSQITREKITAAKQKGYTTVLLFDRSMTSGELSELFARHFHLFTMFDRIRVADEGVLYYLLNESKVDLELQLENGSHNLEAILAWQNLSRTRIKRLILSIQITKDRLLSYLKELECEVEILVAGPISIFYSPRKLLSPLFKGEEEIEAIGKSEESPHKGFLIRESQAGTSMFHVKDIFLFEYLTELFSGGLSSGRIDLYGQSVEVFRSLCCEEFFEVERLWARDKNRGLFLSNRTDVLFKKLKNSHLRRDSASYIGEVVSVSKEDGVLLYLTSPLKAGESVVFKTPDGKEIASSFSQFLTLDLLNVKETLALNYYLVPKIKGVTVRTTIFRE